MVLSLLETPGCRDGEVPIAPFACDPAPKDLVVGGMIAEAGHCIAESLRHEAAIPEAPPPQDRGEGKWVNEGWSYD